ncbi:hypothetical protein ACSBR1_011418 [Camellia fascicularis]
MATKFLSCLKIICQNYAVLNVVCALIFIFCSELVKHLELHSHSLTLVALNGTGCCGTIRWIGPSSITGAGVMPPPRT